MNQTHDLPLIGAIAGAIRWIEELVSLLSGPLLAIGLAVALIDLLTGGSLLRAVPDLLFVWGICQAVGIDAQLIATWDRCRTALRSGAWIQVVALAVLGVALGYVGFLSAEAFGFQQAFGLSEADALQRLGIDAASWQLQRALLAVFLVALSGFTRYHPQKASIEDERAALERTLTLEPLRAQARAMQAIGWRGVAGALTKGTPVVPPTGGGTPVLTATVTQENTSAMDDAGGAHLRVVTTPRRRKNANSGSRRRAGLRKASVEERARQAWTGPGMSIPELQKSAGISRGSAQKYAAMFTAEASEQTA